MDELLERCSDTLLARLAGARATTPLQVRLRAARAIRAQILLMPHAYREALTYRLGLTGELLSDEEIASRLHVELSELDRLYDEAIDALGWALVTGDNRDAAEDASLEVAA